MRPHRIAPTDLGLFLQPALCIRRGIDPAVAGIPSKILRSNRAPMAAPPSVGAHVQSREGKANEEGTVLSVFINRRTKAAAQWSGGLGWTVLLTGDFERA